ncbi:MAG: 30S ribosomal protein S6 [Planctomycetes bacterium]|jgi:small subunit ribosomal protein S6|nr:30S ribosomal protein S6 [Planctomycetota bacterium]
MSKTKQSGLAHYEILFIVPNRFTEEEAKEVIAKVEKNIKDNGGEITYQEYWGKKKLAYIIDHNNYGYYQLLEFDYESTLLEKLDSNLRLSTEILRHQIVRMKKRSSEEIAKAKEKTDKLNAKEEVVEKEEKKEKPDKAKAKEKAKIDLKDLDEKLEGILNAKDLL